MERERLTQLLEKPGTVAREDLVGLKAMAERFPWFTGAHLLLATGEEQNEDVLFDSTLARTAAHIPDRGLLFDRSEKEGLSRDDVSTQEVSGSDTSVPVQGEYRSEQLTAQDQNNTQEEVVVGTEPTTEMGDAEDKAADLLDEQITAAALVSAYDLTWHEKLDKTNEKKATTEEKASVVDASEKAEPAAPIATVEEHPVQQEVDPILAKTTAAQANTEKRSFTDWLELSTESTGYAPVAIAPPAPTPRAALPEPLPQEENTSALAIKAYRLQLPTATTSEKDLVPPIATVKEQVASKEPTPAPKQTTSVTQSRTAVVEQRELLDRFIQQDNPVPATKATFYTPQQAAKKSLEDTTGLVSETLAKIYAAQGNIPKAIDAYKRLGLKHPEKSVYFAALQKELEDRSSTT